MVRRRLVSRLGALLFCGRSSTPSWPACSPATSNHPLQADAEGLRALVTDRLGQRLPGQRENNPLVGLEGRAILLRRLGEAMGEQPEVFGENSRAPPASTT